MEKFEMFGKVKKLQEYFVLKDNKNNFYLVEDVKKFKRLKHTHKEDYKIKKIISNTFFLENKKTITIYDFLYEETVKKLKEIFKENEVDEKLREAVKLGEGADYSEQSIFYDVVKVIEWKNLTGEMNKEGLQRGLGFDGEAASIMLCECENKNLKVIFENVKSYSEGYTVERTEISREVFNACNTKTVRDIFKKIEKIEKLNDIEYEKKCKKILKAWNIKHKKNLKKR